MTRPDDLDDQADLPGLDDLLARSTDLLIPRMTPEQVHDEAGRQRRNQRWRTVAAVTASAAVVALVLGVHLGGSPRTAAPTQPASEAPATPSGVGTTTFPLWDPRKVLELPPAPDDVAGAMPRRIDPPATSPSLADAPIPTALLTATVSDAQGSPQGMLQVRGPAGEWRSIPVRKDALFSSLSPDGTRLLYWYYGRYDEGATVVDLATGESRVLPLPAGRTPRDDESWTFKDEDTVLFGSGNRHWWIDARSGAATRDDEGGVGVQLPMGPDENLLVDHGQDPPRRVSMERTGTLQRVVARGDTVLGTSYQDGPFRAVVADRETLTPRSVLLLGDHDGNYSNWALGPVSVTDDGTALLHVSTVGRHPQGARVVAWDTETGGLSIVSTIPEGVTVGYSDLVFAARE